MRYTNTEHSTFPGSLRSYDKRSITSLSRKTKSPDMIFRSFSPKTRAGASRFSRRRHVSENRIRNTRTSIQQRPSMPMPSPPILDKAHTRSTFRVGKFAHMATSITRLESKLTNLERKMDPGNTNPNPGSKNPNPFHKRRLLRPSLSERASDKQKAAILIQKVWKGYLTRLRYNEAKQRLRAQE